MIPKEPAVLIERIELNKRIDEGIKYCKILYFYAQVGWGKTTSVGAWLKKTGAAYSWLTIADEKNVMPALNALKLQKEESSQNTFMVVMDNFHFVQDTEIIERIIKYISTSPSGVHFLLLSRAPLKVQFNPFVITRQLMSYGEDEFGMSLEEGLLFLKNNGIYLSEEERKYFQTVRITHPLRLNAVINRIRLNNNHLDELAYQQSGEDICDYIKLTLFDKQDKTIQNVLLCLAELEEFDDELAVLVTGEVNAKEILQKIYHTGSGIVRMADGTYRIYWFFKLFLAREQQKRLSTEEIHTINQNAALYYEMKGKEKEALKYSAKAGCEDKIAALLIKAASRGAGAGKFNELESYYRSLSEKTILSHPVLCSGMTMLHSLCLQKKESEYWYQKLHEMKEILPKSHPHYKLLQEQIIYLDIGLPHKGVKGFISILSAASKCFTKNGLRLQQISITGNLPMLMHGGKDFCEWSKSAEVLRRMLKRFLESVFGKAGIGLADIGVGEAYYEQNRLDEALLELTKGTTDARNTGTVEMLFAGTGVLARLMLAKNQYESACSMMEGIRMCIEKEEANHLMPNYRAYMTKLYLLQGNLIEVNKWYENETPDENQYFYILDRYRYLVKARCYIAAGKYIQAEILLEKLRHYFADYKRHFDYMEATLLMAILYYRMENLRWTERLNEVLIKAQDYKFVRVFADEGTAVLTLLNEASEKKLIPQSIKDSYLSSLLEAVKKFAVLYPKYLELSDKKMEELSAAELNVLKLLAEGMSNSEIARFLNVTLSTVKTHSSHIYAKFNVKNRHAAVEKARQQGMF